MRHRLAAIVVTAFAAGPLAGCGSSDSPRQVRSAIDGFARAVRDHDYPALCNGLLARELIEQLRSIGLPCEAALRRGLGGVRRPRLTVGRIQVSGSTATALVHSTAANEQPSDDEIRLVRESGSWRIASLAAPPRRRPVAPAK